MAGASVVNFTRPLNPDLLFAPPYPKGVVESPIEELFLHHAAKYFAEGRPIQTQVWVRTLCGRFRLDFLVDTGTKRVAFECDGEAFHKDLWRDELRDSLILGTGEIDAIYRLPGKVLTFRPEDCFYLVSRWDPELFSPRGLANLQQLASLGARQLELEPHQDYAAVSYREDHDGGIKRLEIERRALAPEGVGCIWRSYWRHAQEWQPRSLDAFIAQMKRFARGEAA